MEEAGRCHGHGLGENAIYYDLVFFEKDIEWILEIIRMLTGTYYLPPSSWLIFHDIYWGKEWIGLFDNSPNPDLPVDNAW